MHVVCKDCMSESVTSWFKVDKPEVTEFRCRSCGVHWVEYEDESVYGSVDGRADKTNKMGIQNI